MDFFIGIPAFGDINHYSVCLFNFIHPTNFYITNIHCIYNYSVIYIPCDYKIKVYLFEDDKEYIDIGFRLSELHLVPLPLYQNFVFKSKFV